MAFNDLGPDVWVDQGKSVTWWYQFDRGADRGAQYASANIVISNPFNPGAILVADEQAKQVNSWEDDRVTYYVRITSIAHGGAWHKLRRGAGVIMDLTLIRDREGNIIAAALGHIADGPPAGDAPAGGAGPMAVEGQTFQPVVAPDEFEEFRRDPDEFGRRLKEHFAESAT